MSDLFNALMTAKITIEDLIGLEAAGHETGFKRGSLQKQLRDLNKGISILTAEDRGT